MSLLFLFVILGTFYIYSKSLTGSFIWDDEHFVLRNPAIQSVEKLPHYFISKETTSGVDEFNIYRPLRNVSYLVNYLISGMEPSGFRIGNLLLHMLNILLLGYLVRLLTGSWLITAFSSILFAFHPIQTEAVSWIKGRDDLLVTFFYLAAFISYILRYKAGRYNNIYCWLSVLFFIFALLSKETAITFPFLIVIYNLCFPNNKDMGAKKSYHPYFYALLIYIIIRTVVVGSVGQTEYWGGSFLASFYTSLAGTVYYLKLLFFPVNLLADYLMFPVFQSVFNPYVIGALIVIILLLGITVLSFIKGQRVLAFSLLWFFITLIPVSNIIPIKIIIAERFLYLPSIGIFLGSAIVLAKIGETLPKGLFYRNKTVIIMFSLVTLLLASMTVDRNTVWTDKHLFWQDIVAKSPENSRGWHNLATIYQNNADLDNAIRLYEKALQMEYHSAESHYQLARIYRGLGQDEAALRQFYEALINDPENADINHDSGDLMAKKGMFSEAISRYRRALETRPNHAEALYDLGMLYMREQDFEFAARQFRKLLLITPDDRMVAGFLNYCESMINKRQAKRSRTEMPLE